MRIHNLFHYGASCATAFALFFSSVSYAEPVDIAINGDMSEAEISDRDWSDIKDTIPVGWKNPMQKKDNGVSLQWVSDDAECNSPGGALKLVVPGGKSVTLGGKLSRTPPPGYKITAKAFVKCPGGQPHRIQVALQPGAYPCPKTGSGWCTLGWWAIYNNGADGHIEEYTEFTMEETIIPDNASSFGLHIMLNNTQGFEDATIWVDDIEVWAEAPVGTTPRTISLTQEATGIRVINSQELTFPSTTNYNVSVISPNGRQQLQLKGHGERVNFDNHDLASGVYVVKVTSDIGNYSGKIIVGK